MIILIIVIVFNNCKEPILLESKAEGGILVVNGKVTTLPGPLTVTLGYTSDVGRIPKPAAGAHVTLVNSLGNTWNYSETTGGVYVIPDSTAAIVPGVSYYVDIVMNNGKQYRSKPEIVPASTGTSEPYVEFAEQKGIVNNTEVTANVVNVFANTSFPLSEGAQYFRWVVEEYYMFEQTPIFSPLTGGIPLPCFVFGYSDPQRINLFTTENLQTDHVDNRLLAVRLIDQSFLARHYFMVNTETISPTTYAYWDHVNSLVNRTGSIFDTPPAPIVGNIYSVNDSAEKVYGYFEANNTTVARIYVLKGQIPFVIPFYCNDPVKGLYSSDYPDECKQCLSLPNSSHQAPPWF